MSTTATLNPAPAAPCTGPPVIWRDVGIVVLLALVARLATYNGAFGSDDLTYFARAAQIARGEWTSSDYNGALRYGFNLPAAGFIALFGRSVFAANLWPIACSLIEIGALMVFAAAAMGRRASICAGLLLASAPLHVAVATRIHADPVVAMFVTLGFVLLYFGLATRRPGLLWAAGVAIGGIFWAKELAAVTWFAFLPMLAFFRGQWKSALYVVAGTLVMLLLHGALMIAIAGDPLHLVKVVLAALKHTFIDAGQGEDGAAYYLRYLFVDPRHVGLLALFAAAACALVPRWLRRHGRPGTGFAFALTWCVSLLVVLSIFPVSLSPLRLTMKQSNYITLFLGPVALLAGMAIAALPRKAGAAGLALCVASGLVLATLQQATYLSFTANTKGLAAFAVAHPRSIIVGSVGNGRLGDFWAESQYPGTPKARVIDFRDVENTPEAVAEPLRRADAVFAVLDRETMDWLPAATPVTAPLGCWQLEARIAPEGLGVGNRLAAVAARAARPVPPVAAAFERLAGPRRADVYRVAGHDVLCRAGQ